MGTRTTFRPNLATNTWLLRLAFVLVLTVAGGGARADSDVGDSETTRDSLRELLSSSDIATKKPSSVQPAVAAYYTDHGNKPIWTGSDDALARAAMVRSVLEKAYLQGLRSSDYVSGLARWKKQPTDGRDAAQYDVALTTALFTYASDVRLGRVSPTDAYKDVSLPPGEFDPAAALARALRRDSIDSFLAGLPPLHPGYRYLANAFVHYLAIALKGDWPTVSAGGGKHVRKGTKDAQLRKRLAIEDPVFAALPHPTADDVGAALIRYQKRNALTESGKLDPDTLKSLNVPASYRARQIAANMERWRWLPRELEHRYVEVDVPDQSVKFIEDGKVLLYSRVVVGTDSDPTPILRTDVRAVIANPPWDIPGDIVAKKILPQLRRQPDYLVARNMVLAGGPADDPHGINIDWKHVTGDLPYQIQQSPGPDNMLGKLMLDMPNPFDVYLHDTANRELFQLGDRLRSHGCVRVQAIAELASLALTDSATGGEDDDLSQAIASGETKRLPLERPLAVYMLYWTAIAWPDGTVSFRPDLYHRDGPLIAKLAAPRPANP